MAIAKAQLRQMIRENDISSVGDIYSLFKESFKDILQELLEAELEASIGYAKNEKGSLETENKRNGHTPKRVKSQYGEFQVDIPEIEPVNLNPESFQNIKETFPALRRKSSRFTPVE